MNIYAVCIIRKQARYAVNGGKAYVNGIENCLARETFPMKVTSSRNRRGSNFYRIGLSFTKFAGTMELKRSTRTDYDEWKVWITYAISV